MNKPSYVCSKCKRAFRRRWNAQRHTDTVHKGLSDIKFKHKQGNSANAINKPDRYHPSFAAASTPWKYRQMHQHNSKDSSFAPFNNSGSPLKKPNKSVVTMDEGEKEDFLNNTLEKMAISIERLEKLFFEKLCIPRKNIENMLSHIIIAALAMPDPVKFIQDKFTYYNRQYYSAKMIKYVAKSYEMDYFAATEYLKSVIGQVFV